MQLTDARYEAPSLDLLGLLLRASLDDWEAAPIDQFRGWLGQRFSAASARVYLSMWSSFVDWLSDHGVALREVEDSHLRDFLDENKVGKHHRYRYIRLIERVYTHLAALSPGLPNPGSMAARKLIGSGRNDPSTCLTVEQRNILIGFLADHYKEVDSLIKGKNNSWRVRRDFALVAAMAAAGLKVSEIQGGSVNCISPTFDVIEVPGRNGRWHRAKVLSFGWAILGDWMAFRRESGTEGQHLFPSSPKGRAMSPVSIYRRAHRMIELAGLDLPSRAAPQTLRNTYASILFGQGEGDEAVAKCLGLAETTSAARLREALSKIK